MWLRRVGSCRGTGIGLVAAILLIAANRAPAQSRGANSGSSQSLADASMVVSVWLKLGTPFAMVKFCSPPKPAENAAPVDLDAFLEFIRDVGICFAPSEALPGRETETKARHHCWFPVHEEFNRDEDAVSLDRMTTRDGVPVIDSAGPDGTDNVAQAGIGRTHGAGDLVIPVPRPAAGSKR